MLDGNVLLRQKRDEVPKGTLSCPDRIMEVCYQLRHYEGSHLLLSVCGRKLIQQTLNSQGRIETFSNVLPRYVLFSLTWKFNKKRKNKL